MDLFIERDTLSRGLARIQSVIERRSTHPLLSHVLLHARDGSDGQTGGLKVTATDTEVAFIGDLEANVSKSGQLAVDAASFFQIVRALPETTVQLTLTGNNRLEIRSGRALFKLPGHPAEDYPPLPAFDAQGTMRMKEADLKRLVEQTSFAVASDDGGMYGLNGAYMEAVELDGERRLRLVATDGHRLSSAEAAYEGDAVITPRTLVPRKALTVIRKLLGSSSASVDIGFGQNAIRLTQQGQVFWFRMLDAEFPDYNAVLPKECKHVVLGKRAELASCLKRVMILVADRTQAVRFKFQSSELDIRVHNVDRGESEESVAVSLEGEAIEVGFNAKYLQDILSVLPEDDVRIELAHPLAPCLVKNDGHDDAFFVVMPMRLD